MTVDEIREKATQFGFHVVGAAPVEPVGGGWFAPHSERFQSWLDQGQHAEMAWMAQRAAERVVPERLLPGVRTAIVLWMNHRTPTPERPPDRVGRVAAYAWGRDYHNVVRKALRKLERWMFSANPDMKRYVSVDTGAVLERAFGERASSGWIGRSTMLIHPELGTFGSLAVMFVDFDLETPNQEHPFRCGTCTACIDECPTGALSDGVLDARLCISYWTIEHRGLIPSHIRPMLGTWVFGCDICQDVCPWNNDAPRADPDLWRPQTSHAWPDLEAWLSVDSAVLEERLLGSPLRRAKGQGLRRNALIVLANAQVDTALPVVERVLEEDPDPVLRATAAWAAQALGSKTAHARAKADPDPMVRAEAR